MHRTQPALPRIPASTYRLQFNGAFRFIDAAEIIPYLHDLGITDIYASPYLKAKKGSLHGYDIVDHSRLNPEIGTEEDYDIMINALEKFDMGQILDVVPNHMCITGSENKWWMDVLENGKSSLYADFFDIEWDPAEEELEDKVLIPILGDQYGRVLENREITLSFEEGAFYASYYDNKLPIRPQTYTIILEYGLDRLKERLPQDDPFLMDFLSVLTALKHLPPFTEQELERVMERIREKEVVKRRLANLCKDCPEIESFIHENVTIFNGTRNDPRSFDLLDGLLREQVYRLSYWPVATEQINYRRFFDINNLAAIRVEKPEVFRKTHDLLFRLVKEGKVTGLRIDHPDGLYDPCKYFESLQRECFASVMAGYTEKIIDDHDLPYGKGYVSAEISQRYEEMLTDNPQAKPFYILGEKILTKSERMPEEWPIYSTTGYVFLNSLNGIFVQTKNAKAFDRIYSAFARSSSDYQDLVYRNKKLIMEVAMASEINTLGHRLNRLSEKSRYTRDFTLNSLTKAVMEVVAFFPVYRTYINGADVKERDRQYIDVAISRAKRRNPAISGSIFDFLRDVILLRFPKYSGDADKEEWLDFAMRFQQITGPVMAKGVEDTTFYVYNRLVSLNEVGGSPDRFGTSLDTFHGQNIERCKFWPHALIASSTHDSKRGEDARARINVLSEIPLLWREHLLAWSKLNRRKKVIVDGQPVPDKNEEYLLYQTLVGSWLAGSLSDTVLFDIYKQRIKRYMVKAIREAKINSSWINPNSLYEEALTVFIEAVLDNSPDNRFLLNFVPFQELVSLYGTYNSLAQTLLKVTSPGIPDFYQGTELWDFTLVDPDNRGPVNYIVRKAMLEMIKKRESEAPLIQVAREMMAAGSDGKMKLYVIYKALNHRKAHRAVFEKGGYTFLQVMGEQERHVCAFARRFGDAAVIVAVPRFFLTLRGENGFEFPGENVWADSVVALPADGPGVGYRNIFTGEILETANHRGVTGLRCSEIFGNFPVALLEKIDHRGQDRGM
ncbi:MAG: Maltooligosyl trehalose synthase [Syntrophorhabdus sp. PtaU1.Bin153]|nr:MAG: Maltooligosyl trehalose synthase [Syntrophorhabdus sp. PtaU1.Bin153]